MDSEDDVRDEVAMETPFKSHRRRKRGRPRKTVVSASPSSKVKVMESVKPVPDEKEFRCPSCTFQGSMTELYEHVSDKHKEPKTSVTEKAAQFRCPKCNYSGSSEEELQGHVKITHMDKIAFDQSEGTATKCQMCTYIGKDKFALHRHMKRFHMEAGNHGCEHCDYTGTRVALGHHMRRYHPEQLNKCDKCSKLFTKKRDLLIHKTTHDANELLVKQEELVDLLKGSFTCKKCFRVFHRKHEYQRHIKAHLRAENKVKLKCDYCDYETFDKYDIRDHTARRHEERKFVCPTCGKTYGVKSDLTQHLKYQHTSAGKCVCHLCGKTFTAPRYLASHMQRHNGVKRHKCPICDKGFFEKCKMIAHMDIHKKPEERGRKYKCTQCDKEFHSRSYWKDHQNKHSGERPYACKLCSKTFATSTCRNKHMLYHSTDRPFKCPYCIKAFRMQAKLNYHMVVHTGKSKHVCDKCNKVYTQYATLKRHKCKPRSATAWRHPPKVAPHTANIASMTTVEMATESVVAAPQQTEMQYVWGEQELVTVAVETEATNTPQELYMCSICDKIYQDWDVIQAHMLEHQEREELKEQQQHGEAEEQVEQVHYGEEEEQMEQLLHGEGEEQMEQPKQEENELQTDQQQQWEGEEQMELQVHNEAHLDQGHDLRSEDQEAAMSVLVMI